MSLISNIAFYEKQLLMVNDFELNRCKQDVYPLFRKSLNLIPNFIVQIEHEELCLEGLRILANYSRQKVSNQSLFIQGLPQGPQKYQGCRDHYGPAGSRRQGRRILRLRRLDQYLQR